MTLQQDRQSFNTITAPELAKTVGVKVPSRGNRSTRFAYFADEKRLAVIAGAQEGSEVDLAFALGLTYRGDRRLVLVLPEQHAFATLQRAPWFTAEARPEVWIHDGGVATRHTLSTKDDTIAALTLRLKSGQTLEEELRAAATPTHLGAKSSAVFELVEWATTHPLLDGSHRRGERAWHCMGQKVLSIKGASSGLVITAGIHYSEPGEAPHPHEVTGASGLDRRLLEIIQEQVEEGARARLDGSHPIHRPDEHWLQAVIRRDPSLVGVEHPALRELPAWRPRVSKSDVTRKWGRGYIDLIGVDGHGDVRIVETKIADNQDDLLVFQGLDYYIWAQAYREVLLGRLGAPTRAEFEIHYVIGDTTSGAIHVSNFAAAQARSLDDRLRWRFQTVHDWYRGPTDPGRATSHLLPLGKLP